MGNGNKSLQPVTAHADIEQVVQLAKAIWTEHYTPIIGKEQVAYMLDKYQSSTSILQQISEGMHYFMLGAGQPAGYLAFKVEDDTLFVSKIYLLDSCRGKGYGNKMMHFAELFAIQHQCSQLRLTVNKYNAIAIQAYLKMGFTQHREVVFDIGNGYVMDDYEMVKSL